MLLTDRSLFKFKSDIISMCFFVCFVLGRGGGGGWDKLDMPVYYIKYIILQMLPLKPYHMHTFCVCWHEASLSLTLITPLSALFKETCILPVSCNSRCLPDKALIVSAQLSVKGASLCPCSCSCWANGSVSTVDCQQQCSQGLTAAMCGTGAHQHRLITPSLPRAKRDIPPTSCVLFIYTLDVEVDIVAV